MRMGALSGRRAVAADQAWADHAGGGSRGAGGVHGDGGGGAGTIIIGVPTAALTPTAIAVPGRRFSLRVEGFRRSRGRFQDRAGGRFARDWFSSIPPSSAW